ncbi:MAG: hypothetical protein ACOCRK_02975 [bacterium]
MSKNFEGEERVIEEIDRIEKGELVDNSFKLRPFCNDEHWLRCDLEDEYSEIREIKEDPTEDITANDLKYLSLLHDICGSEKRNIDAFIHESDDTLVNEIKAKLNDYDDRVFYKPLNNLLVYLYLSLNVSNVIAEMEISITNIEYRKLLTTKIWYLIHIADKKEYPGLDLLAEALYADDNINSPRGLKLEYRVYNSIVNPLLMSMLNCGLDYKTLNNIITTEYIISEKDSIFLFNVFPLILNDILDELQSDLNKFNNSSYHHGRNRYGRVW